MSGILWQARATFKSYATYWLMKGINNDGKHTHTHSEPTIYSGREMMNESNEMSENDEGKLVTYKIWWIIFFELVGISSTRTSNIWNFILKAIYHFWLWQANGYDEERNGTHTRKKTSEMIKMISICFLFRLSFDGRVLLPINKGSDRKISN